MTLNQPSLAVDPEGLDRVEELIRHLVAHDGRLPTDDMPLAWWLVEILEQPHGSPAKRLLQGIPVTEIGRGLVPGRVATWAKFVARLDQLDWMERRSEAMDDAKGDDLAKWAESTVVRYLSGTMKSTEELLLRKRPVWSFERPLSPRRRSDVAMTIGLRAVKEFHRKHGHTDVPGDLVIEGVNLALWWKTVRDRYAGKGMKPHERQRLEGLKLDLSTNAQLAKAEKERRAEEERQRVRAEKAGKLASQRGTADTGAVMDAIRAFAAQHGHTGIPVGAVTDDGVEFGRLVDRWRRAKPLNGLDSKLRKHLESVEHWTWIRAPASPTIQRPAPVAIPEDTTQMNRSGLRQFRPAD